MSSGYIRLPLEGGGGTGAVDSVNGQTGVVVLDTGDINEDGNLYFTDLRAQTAAVVNSLAGSETTQAPSVAAVNSALGPIAPLVEYQQKDAQRNSFLKYYVFENNAAIYADSSFAPTQDPSPLLRDGWHFKNTTLNSKFNYYFYDASNPISYEPITLGETSIYTVMTFDAVDDGPILSIYTIPLGDGNDAASWYRSRLNYSGYATPGFTPEIGKKYLIYGGEEPQVHPELPRIQLNQSSITTVGPLAPDEQVLTMAIGSNSSAAQNTVDWIIERAGCNATSFKYDFEFRILPIQQEVIETAFSDRYRADSVALGSGVSTASVTFSSALATADYTITYSLVNLVDVNPKFLDIIVTAKSTTGFSVKFHQNTDSANYLLEYICIVHS